MQINAEHCQHPFLFIVNILPFKIKSELSFIFILKISSIPVLQRGESMSNTNIRYVERNIRNACRVNSVGELIS